jgi:hypothetical protein
MRQEKTIPIDGKDIAVREMKTSDVCALFDSNDGLQTLVGVSSGMPGDVKKLLKMSLDPISQEEFDALTENINAYSELETVFYEVNGPFFASLPGKIDNLLRLGGMAAKKMGVSLKSLASSSGKGT